MSCSLIKSKGPFCPCDPNKSKKCGLPIYRGKNCYTSTGEAGVFIGNECISRVEINQRVPANKENHEKTFIKR